MQGEGKSGGKPEGNPVEATIFRTKTEFDPDALKKIPGAREYTADGLKYYTIDDIPELKYPGIRVFAPTNRLVVFCRGDMDEGKFRAMLKGNPDNEKTPFSRAGPLIKAVTRGTVWKIILYDRSIARMPTPVLGKDGRETDEDMMKKEIAELCAAAKGTGFKASLGSREVRGEWSLWFKDSDAASSMAKKWKEKEWVKDDEKSPPRWWKILAGKSGGDKTAENALRDALSFRYSGEIFTIRTALEAKTLQQNLTTLVQAFLGGQQGGFGPGGGGPGLGGAPGGGPPAPGPGGGPPPPGKRSRFWVRRRRGLLQQKVH